MPGLSVYVTSFKYKGIAYYWDYDLCLFASSESELTFISVPVGAYGLVLSREA